VTFPAFKAGDSALRGPNGGFDFHTPPPNQRRGKDKEEERTHPLHKPQRVGHPRGNRRMSGGKKSTRGTPQGGGASPLLANIYRHRFIKAFRKYALDLRYGAVLVTYADDFVILCRHGAAEVLETTRRWMTSIGLALNEKKTRVCNARCESFDFLGYTCGPMYSPRTGGRYNGAQPSKRAVASIKDSIRQRLRPGNQAPWEEVARDLNRTVRDGPPTFPMVRWRKRAMMWHFICTTPFVAFSAAGTRWPGLGTDSFPCKMCLGRWAFFLPNPAPASFLRIP